MVRVRDSSDETNVLVPNMIFVCTRVRFCDGACLDLALRLYETIVFEIPAKFHVL